MAQKNGKSISELVRIALLDLEKDFSTTIEDAQKTGKEEGTNIGYKNGYTEGYNNGKNEWAISIPCWKCKQLVHIKPNSKERTRVIELLKDKVHHPECCSLYYDNIPS